MIGQEISHFRILEILGAGGMGTVYRAFDLRLEREVAIKVLPGGALADDEARERFRREARAASALSHPNIVTVHEIDTSDGVDFIAMEVVEGRPLNELLTPGGMELERVLAYAVEAAEALAVAHRHGIVHRDLKPANLMVTPDDRIKILDFGLAKRLLAPSAADTTTAPTHRLDSGPSPPIPRSDSHTAPGVILGTPHYMAPEQADGSGVDVRSDVFAFGCLLYRMLTGELPFRGETTLQVLASILRDPPRPLRELRPEVPASLARLVGKALAKGPDDRHRDGGELLADLRAVRRELTAVSEATAGGLADDPAAPATAESRSLRGPRRLAPWLVAAVAVLAAVVGTLIVGTTSRERIPPVVRASAFRPISDLAGDQRQASFSPDGNLLTFIADDEAAVPQVWVKNLSGGAPLQVTAGEPAAGHPRWTPRGDALVFARQRKGIWRAPSLGGPANRLVDHGTRPDVATISGRLVFEHQARLWTADADGSDVRQVPGVGETYFKGYVALAPAFSPDGTEISYFQPGESPVGELRVIPVEGGPGRVVQQGFQGGESAWTPDGRSIVYSSDAAGARNLWIVPAHGGEAYPLTVGAGQDTEPHISSDGRTLVYTHTRKTYSLMLTEPTGHDRILFESHRAIALPTVSPAGDRIAFFSPTSEGIHLFTVGIDGSGLLQVTRNRNERYIVPQWSSDGSYLYHYRRLSDPAFARVPSEGGESVDVVPGWTWTVQNFACVDAQERRVVYTRMRQSRALGTRVRELATGREWDLGATLTTPRWSPDGSRVIGSTEDGELVLCPVEGDACRTFGRGFQPRWGPAGHVFAIRPTGEAGDIEVWRYQPDGTAPVSVAVLHGIEALTFSFDVLEDGSLVWCRSHSGRQELWLADLHQDHPPA